MAVPIATRRCGKRSASKQGAKPRGDPKPASKTKQPSPFRSISSTENLQLLRLAPIDGMGACMYPYAFLDTVHGALMPSTLLFLVLGLQSMPMVWVGLGFLGAERDRAGVLGAEATLHPRLLLAITFPPICRGFPFPLSHIARFSHQYDSSTTGNCCRPTRHHGRYWLWW